MARGDPVQVRLQFNQPLKGCPNAELQKRLRALHEELAEIDQDLIDTTSLDSVAKALLAPALLLHKERGVKAYLACCLADILRLYAPEAPYTQAELKDLFQFLFRQLKNLTTASEPHFSEYFYLIESLSNVKSIVLICDLDSADELMAEIFKQSFDVISTNSPKNVEICVADILMQLLEEAPTLTSEVVDTLLAQFLPKAAKQRPAAFRLAVDVCEGATDKLQRFVCQYFAEVITSTISGGGEDEDEDEDDESEDDRKGAKTTKGKGLAPLPTNFITAHLLVKQINRSVPSLLLNVIPQLEEELGAEKPEYRKLATEVLGSMLGEKLGQGDLASKYPATWKAWLGRSRDKFAAVRLAMVEALQKIWTEHAELAADVGVAMEKLLVDPDDKVRTAACTVFEELNYETACHHVSKQVLMSLAERCKDRKAAVRTAAFKALGRLYDLAFSEIENRDDHAIEHFAWIPGALLDTTMVGTTESNINAAIRISLDATVQKYLLPAPKKEDEEVQWVDRLLLVMRHLSDNHVLLLLTLSRLALFRTSVYDAFITFCERNNGGIIDEDEEQIKANLKRAVQTISAASPDPSKTAEDLMKFAKANEKQLYKGLRTLLDIQLDLKTLIKTYKDVMRRLEQVSSTIIDTFTNFIRSSSFLLLNRSSIPTLLKRLQSPSGPDGQLFADRAAAVLEFISKKRPELYQTHVAELTKVLSAAKGDKQEKVVEVALHAVSKLMKGDKTIIPDKKLADRAKHYAKTGTPRQAKFAATIVALDTSRPGAADDLVEYLADELLEDSDDALVAHLSALTRLARFADDAFETKSEQITTSALDILTRGAVPGEVLDADATWVEDETMDPLVQARILVIHVFTNRCIAYAETDQAEQVAEPVFKLLWPLLRQSEDEKYAPSTSSRLRLAAATGILKLACFSVYQSAILNRFEIFAQTAQDACFEVRFGFVNKLLHYLRTKRFGATVVGRYNMVLFLVAHDPEDEIRVAVKQYIASSCRSTLPHLRQAQLEHPFVRLLHLLAHHPDFAGDEHDENEIVTVAKYIEMYLECLATQENVPYLYHLALKVKTVRDIKSAEYDNNLYVLSELAQHLIKLVAKSHNWALPTHPGKTSMPSDIFKPLTDTVRAKQIASTTYLSNDLSSAVTIKGRSGPKPEGASKKATIPRKRKSPTAATSRRTSKGRRAKEYDSSDEDEDEESEPESEIEEDEDGVPIIKEKKVVKAVAPRSANARKGLRSDPNAAVEKEEENGTGEMEVDSEKEDEEAEEEDEDEATPPPPKKSKPSPATKKTTATNGGKKSPAKAAVRAPTKAKPKAKPTATTKGKKANGASPVVATKRATRGFGAPKELKTVNKGKESDVSDGEDGMDED